eukprot:SAG22_NODE_191_length_15699_cov_19.660192_4_plen_134_part_00
MRDQAQRRIGRSWKEANEITFACWNCFGLTAERLDYIDGSEDPAGSLPGLGYDVDLAEGEASGGEGEAASRGDQIVESDVDLEEELEAMLREQDELDRVMGQGEQDEPDGEEGDTENGANIVDSSGLQDLMNK